MAKQVVERPVLEHHYDDVIKLVPARHCESLLFAASVGQRLQGT